MLTAVGFAAVSFAQDGSGNGGTPEEASLPPVTASFQNGVAPTAAYQGTEDTTLRSETPTTAYGAATTVEVDGSPDVGALIRWDLSSIPAGSAIESASVTITVHVVDSTGDTYEIYEAKRPWEEATATWNVWRTGESWQVAGAQGADDRGSTVLGSFGPAASTGQYTLALNDAGVAVVQKWVDNPGLNHGLVIQDYSSTSNSIDFASSEAANASDRPRLTLTYTPAETPSAVVTVTATDASASETGPNKGTFTISRTGATTAALTVDYTITGTASSSDYTETLSGSVQIPLGSSNVTLDVTPVDDNLAEGSETVTLTLNTDGYAVGTPYSATITIADNDGAPPTATTRHFQNGVSPTAAYAGTTDTMMRSSYPNTNYGNSAYLQVDGSPDEGTLIKWDLAEIPAGSTIQSASITVNVSGASTETYELYALKRAWVETQATWNVYATGMPWAVPGANGTDDRGAAVLGVMGPSAVGFHTFALTAAGVAQLQSWVDNPASNNGFVILDYAFNSDGLYFRSSETGVATERPKLSVTYLPSAVVTPSVTVAATDASASETGPDKGTFTISRSGPTTAALSVNFTVTGTASASDYGTLTSPINFPSGQSSVTLDVIPIDDSLLEGNETVILTVTSGTGYTVGTPSSATITIADNEAPTTATKSFQNGAFPTAAYAGTIDTTLKAATPATNYGTSTTLEVDGDPDKSGLIKWDISEIPAGATVQSVSISVTVTDETSQTYEIYELKRPWSESTATWNQYAAGFPWQVPGANGTNDRGTTVLGTLGPTAAGAYTINLNSAGKAVVQKWISNPGLNNGLIILDYTNASNGVDFKSSETAIATERPKLNITYVQDGAAATVVTVAATDASASEAGPDNGTFTVTRTGPTTSNLIVNYTLSGTATNGTDYNSLTGSVIIPSGATTATVTVVPIDDALDEPNETVILTLATDGYSVGVPSSATVTIADDDGAAAAVTKSFQNGVAPTAAYVGNLDTTLKFEAPTTNFGNAALLEVDGSPDKSALIKWDVTDIPAGASVQSATITVYVTDTTTQTYEIYEMKRPWVEGQATWNQYAAGLPWQVPGADGTSDRGSTVLGVLTSDTTGARTYALNSAGLALLQTWVSNPGLNNGLIILDYLNASNGLDFRSSEASVATERPKLSVTYIPDGTAATVVTVAATDATAAETGGNTGTFTVTRTGDTGSALTVNFSVSGTATSGTDYTALGASVLIPAGATSATVTVTPIDDATAEGDETVILTLAAGGYSVGTPSSATVTIAASDGAPPANVTTVFKNGVSPTAAYAGMIDTTLRSEAPTTNYGSLGTVETDGSPDKSMLLKWDLSAIPTGSTIVSATVNVNVTSGTSDTYELYELKRAWVEGQATWNQYATGLAWAVPGANGTADRGTTVLGVAGPTSRGVYSFNLNAAGVAKLQQWVDGTAANNGFVLLDYVGASDGLDFWSSEAIVLDDRPSLSVTYTPPAVFVTTVSDALTAAPLDDEADAVGCYGQPPMGVILLLGMSGVGLGWMRRRRR